MPEGMSHERKRMIEAYGAALVLTPGAGTDIDLALAEMREIVAEDPDAYFFPGEFENPDNPEAQEASGDGDLGADRRAGRRGRRVAGDRRLDHRRHARAEGQRAAVSSRTPSSPPSAR